MAQRDYEHYGMSFHVEASDGSDHFVLNCLPFEVTDEYIAGQDMNGQHLRRDRRNGWIWYASFIHDRQPEIQSAWQQAWQERVGNKDT